MSDDTKPPQRREPGIGTRLWFSILRTVGNLYELVPSLVMSVQERRRGGMRAAEVEGSATGVGSVSSRRHAETWSRTRDQSQPPSSASLSLVVQRRNVQHTTAGLFVLFSASLLALASCDRDSRRSNGPTALAPAPSALPDQAHLPTPAARAPAASAPSSQEPSSPTEERAFPCPTIACFSGLIINVYPQEGWPAGRYRFVIRHDGKTTTCNGRIPRLPREPSVGIACNSRAAIWEDGGFEIHSHPAAVDIDVVRDGVRLTHVHYDVVYEESWCGGPGCGSYRSAGVDLKLPAMP